MALIACPDCEKAVSDAAPACIHCGRPSPGAPLPPSAHDWKRGICTRCGAAEAFAELEEWPCWPRRVEPTGVAEPRKGAEHQRTKVRSNPVVVKISSSRPGATGETREADSPERVELLLRLRAYIGPKWDSHYRRRFEELLDAKLSGTRAGWTWNWAAALMPIWFPYRRLYAALAGLLAVAAVITLLDYAAAGNMEGGSPVAILFLGLMVAQGYFADRLLFRKAWSVVTAPDAPADPNELARLGKPIKWVAWLGGMLVVLPLLLFWILGYAMSDPSEQSQVDNHNVFDEEAAERAGLPVERVRAIGARTEYWAGYYGIAHDELSLYLAKWEVRQRMTSNREFTGVGDVSDAEIREVVRQGAVGQNGIPGGAGHQPLTDDTLSVEMP